MLGLRVDNESGDESVLAEVFKVFDKDGSGFIERNELQVGMDACHQRLTHKCVRPCASS